MKKLLLFGFVAALGLAGCEYDDSDILDRLGKVEARLDSLEKNLNSTIEAIRGLERAVEEKLSVTNVTKMENGFDIDFSDGSHYEIRNGTNGTDGTDGTTPEIGVKEEDGVLYWQVNGDWLYNPEGKKVPVYGEKGTTPQFKYEDGKWWINCSDTGEDWKEVGAGNGGGTNVTIVEETDFEVTIQVGEKTYTFPRIDSPLTLNIQNATRFTFNVDVKTGIMCKEYVLGVITEGEYSNFNEANFRRDAESILGGTPGMYRIHSGDSLFTESEINVNDIFPEILANTKFTVAAYVVQTNGRDTVVTKQVTLPDTADFTGTIEPTVIPFTAYTTLVHVVVEVEAAGCSRMLVKLLDKDPKLEDLATDDDKLKFVRDKLRETPFESMGGQTRKRFEFPEILSYNTPYYVLVIPMDASGKIGKMTVSEVKTKDWFYNDKALSSITKATVTQSDWKDDIHISLDVKEGNYPPFKGVRIMCVPKEDAETWEDWNLDEMNFYLQAETGEGVYWTFFGKDQLNDITMPVVDRARGTEFYIYAVAVDGTSTTNYYTDRYTDSINVATLAGVATENGTFLTKAKPQFELNGTGTASFKSLTEVESGIPDYMDITFTVTKDENCKEVYYAVAGKSTYEQEVKDAFETYPDITDDFGQFNKLSFPSGNDSEETTAKNVETVFGEYGSVLVIITVDNSNGIKIAAVHDSGSGNEPK